MFEIGFAELFLLGVIALLVVGPDRLPALARTVGVWVGKAQRLVGQVRADIEREVRADELRKAAKEYSPTAVIADVKKEVEAFAGDAATPVVDRGAKESEAEGRDAGAAGPNGVQVADPTEAPRAEPPAATPAAADPAGGPERGEAESGEAPGSTEPASVPDAEPEAVKPTEDTEISSSRAENAAPPAATQRAEAPPVERDERTAAP